MTTIKLPEYRRYLIDYLDSLSSVDYQRRTWAEGKTEGPVQHDEFDYSVHFLYDDTDLASDSKSMIGWVLRDENEAKKIALLVSEIDTIFEKYGKQLSDEQYIELPEWIRVVTAAKDALLTIREPENQ